MDSSTASAKTEDASNECFKHSNKKRSLTLFLTDGNKHKKKIIAHDVTKPGAKVKYEKIIANTKHHTRNTKNTQV